MQTNVMRNPWLIVLTLVFAAGLSTPHACAVEPLRPCGLIADADNGIVLLDWNPSTFDEVIGWHVYRAEGEKPAKRITKDALKLPEYADTAVANGNGPPHRILIAGLRPSNDEPGRWIYDGVLWGYDDGRYVEYPNDLPQ